MINTAKELVAACLDLANNHKTLYVMGCFGAPMTATNKDRYIAHHEYNRRAARTKMIRATSADTFGFDCVCMIKGLLWGWDGDVSHIYGGAKYASNNVPDIGANQIINVCTEVSTDFGNMQPGELLWMKGHVGIYVGDGNCVECTPGWKNCVQVTAVKNIKAGNGHLWTKHGKLPYVTYDGSEATKEPTVTEHVIPQTKQPATTYYSVRLPVLKKGMKNDTCKILQVLLNHHLPDRDPLELDGSFGPATERTVEAFQDANNLEADKKVGPATWTALLNL